MDLAKDSNGIMEVIGLLRSINDRLDSLAFRDELLDYRAAATRLGISERKLSDLVIKDRLIEGWHYLRIDGSVRFPPDIARRFMKVAPKQASRASLACNPAPEMPHTLRMGRPTNARGKTGPRSSFNLDF